MDTGARVEWLGGRSVCDIEKGLRQGQLAEIDNRLGCIYGQFAEELAGGPATLIAHKRLWVLAHEQAGDVEASIRLAEGIRRDFAAFVLVGVGGSDLGARTLHDCLDHPEHNLLLPEERGGAPEMHFAGDTFDPKRVSTLLALLQSRGLLSRTVFNLVSKSGTTTETLAAALIIKDALKEIKRDWRQHVVLTTGSGGANPLWRLHSEAEFYGVLPVPDGIGGRFSFATPSGLLLLAVSADANRQRPPERVHAALAGYRAAHARLLLPCHEQGNTAFRLARFLQLVEQHGRRTTVVLYNFADDRMLGDWFTQLWAESLQERGAGMNVLATRGTTGNHSVLNGILRGPRDKVVMFVRWEDLSYEGVVPASTEGIEQMKPYSGAAMSRIQDAAWRATAEDFTASGIPCVTLSVARRDGPHLFALMRTLMDTVAVKGRLQGLHLGDDFGGCFTGELTYTQDGVEGYKDRMRKAFDRPPGGQPGDGTAAGEGPGSDPRQEEGKG